MAVNTHAANDHEVTLVRLSFDSHMIEARPENLTGDRAYDSDDLDEQMKKDAIEVTCRTLRTGGNRRPRTGVGCVAMSDAG